MRGLSRPMRGRRAPEFAAGRVLDVLSESWQGALAELTLQCRNLLTAEQWAALLLDFERGKAHCTYIVLLKFAKLGRTTLVPVHTGTP